MGGSTSMVPPERALAGRQEKMRIAAKHFVLGNQMEGPFPEHLETCYFANGCFVRALAH